MENASKALIIAGAILLSILLISLGIMIFNTAQDTTKNSGMTQAQVAAFNNKFSKYEGKIKGSEVRSLIQEVVASNGDDNNKNASRKITIKKDNKAIVSDTSADSSGILTTQSYTVKITEYNGDGTIKTITIEE
ncbi:hypothetical protein EGR52_07730 [bacterium]|nr:hypothetical protein [bacterium]